MKTVAARDLEIANDDTLVQVRASHSVSKGDGAERTDTVAKGRPNLKAARSPESVLFGQGCAEPGVRSKKGKATRVNLSDRTSSVTSATGVVAPTDEVTFQIVIPGDKSEENESVTSIHSSSEDWKETNEETFSLIIGTPRVEDDLNDEVVVSPVAAPATSGARPRKAKAARGEVDLVSTCATDVKGSKAPVNDGALVQVGDSHSVSIRGGVDRADIASKGRTNLKNERFSEDGLIEDGVMNAGIRSKKVKATRAETTFPDNVEDNLKEGKTARVKVGPNDGGADPVVVISANSGVGSGKVKVERAKVRLPNGGSKRSRTSAPDGMPEEVWAAMKRQQRKDWLKRNK
jgi:hypothetical protein